MSTIITVIITWIVITGAAFCIGELIYLVFKDSFFSLKTLSGAGMLGIVFMAFEYGMDLKNAMIIFIGVLLWIQYVKIYGKLPSGYHKFAVIKESLSTSTFSIFAFELLSLFTVSPELQNYLPGNVEHFERYVYFDIFIIIIIIIISAPDDIKIPDMVLNFINEHEIITQEMIDEFALSLESYFSNDSDKDFEEIVYKTLADFAKQGALVIDDENKCFRRTR